MQIYINKNGQQFGPFDELDTLQMMQTGEISAEDYIFRQGDSEWSKVGSLYQISKITTVKFTVKSGLVIGGRLSDFQPIDVVFFKVPGKSLETNKFSDDYRQQFFCNFFGENWRNGNTDGSYYTILEENIEPLSTADLPKFDRKQPEARLYLVKAGILVKVDLSEFETAPDFVEKITKKFIKPKFANNTGIKKETKPPTSTENSMLQTIRLRLDEKIKPHAFLRKLIEFETWQVLIFNRSNHNIAETIPDFVTFYSKNKSEKAVYLFSDSPAVSDYIHSVGENNEAVFRTLSGENVFGFHFPELDYICINPYSETSVDLPSNQFEHIKAMVGSIKIEKKLKELHAGNRDDLLLKELSEHRYYFWVFESLGETFRMKDTTGKTTLPIFTSIDYFELYQARYREKFSSVDGLLKYELIDGVELGTRILLNKPDKVVFNIFSGYVVNFSEEIGDLLVAS
jgi:GYF domain 2